MSKARALSRKGFHFTRASFVHSSSFCFLRALHLAARTVRPRAQRMPLFHRAPMGVGAHAARCVPLRPSPLRRFNTEIVRLTGQPSDTDGGIIVDTSALDPVKRGWLQRRLGGGGGGSTRGEQHEQHEQQQKAEGLLCLQGMLVDYQQGKKQVQFVLPLWPHYELIRQLRRMLLSRAAPRPRLGLCPSGHAHPGALELYWLPVHVRPMRPSKAESGYGLSRAWMKRLRAVAPQRRSVLRVHNTMVRRHCACCDALCLPPPSSPRRPPHMLVLVDRRSYVSTFARLHALCCVPPPRAAHTHTTPSPPCSAGG